MEMNFPHLRHASSSICRTSDFAALVAAAGARQSVSATVKAMSAPKSKSIPAGDRIAFFAGELRSQPAPRGAFATFAVTTPVTQGNSEDAVYLAGSINGKQAAVETAHPETDMVQRGTEV